jgi:sialate O-acetylesterase
MKHILFLMFIPLLAYGKVSLPALVADNMVLQRDKPVMIWGKADVGETVTVSLLKKSWRTTADSSGRWSITLPPQKAGGPYSITVNDIVLNNILFGDVWLCSGQSNMETPIPRLLERYGDEIRNYSNSLIRYVKIPTATDFHSPREDVPPAPWLELDPVQAMNYSALPYFFAKELFEKIRVPVGIVNASVGGTPIEAWVSEASLSDFPAYLNDKRICESDEYIAAMQRAASIPGRRYAEIMTQQDKGLNGALRWSDVLYDDSGWSATPMFDNSWARNGFRPVFGVFWLRRYVDIPPDMAGRKATLYLGRIEGADSVYINGKYVGNTTYQYPPRIYPLPEGILHSGRNLITVRMSGGSPSFVRGKSYKIVFDDSSEPISVEGEWKYKVGVIMPPPEAAGGSFTGKPVGLYNGMIAPLRNFTFKGAVWYQGESNADRYTEYYRLLTSLISDWRRLWNDDLPFFIIQLPNYMEPSFLQAYSSWAELREVQRQVARDVPKASLVVAIDLGEWNDIHPLNKKDLGIRLSLQVRKQLYGENIVADGPVFLSAVPVDGKMKITFRDGSNDLMPVDDLKGFLLAGSDGIYREARAAVTPDRAVMVWHDDIPNPVKVRYAWSNNPDGANLRNRSGLPASPFQYDINNK